MSVTPGRYELLVEAFGFGRAAVDRRRERTTNFALTQRWSVTQFTGADIDQLIPDHPPAQMLKSMCINCHALDVMLRRRGATAAQWRAYAEKQMPVRIGRPFTASDAEWKVLGAELERWFGPKGSISDQGAEAPPLSQVSRAKMAPEVARATFYEYTLPNARSMPHSLTVDGAGRVWISGWDSATNAVLKFDPPTEQFRTYPVPTANAVPHTPCDHEGWARLDGA